MRNSSLRYVLTVVVVLAGAYGFWTAWRVRNRAGAASMPAPRLAPAEQGSAPPLSEFTLTERSGEPFRSRDMLGEVWVASFFFTNCPAVCREVNTRLAGLQEDASLRDVRIVSITSDPINDTLERLEEYAKFFKADPQRWLFCRGEAEYTRRIGEDFMKVAANGAAHSERIVVFDRAGKIRGRFIVTDSHGPNQLRQMHAVLQACLAEPPPAANSPAEGESSESSPSSESGEPQPATTP